MQRRVGPVPVFVLRKWAIKSSAPHSCPYDTAMLVSPLLEAVNIDICALILHNEVPTSTTTLGVYILHLAPMSEPRAPVVPSCVAKIGYEETVKKVYETIQVGKGRRNHAPAGKTPLVDHALQLRVKRSHDG